MTKAELTEILERHQKWLNDDEGGERANLSCANLSGADLYRANLNGAVLYRANLFNANLNGANLSYAKLSGEDLFNANLNGANLSYANLSYANLFNANLYGANLSYANLSYAKLFNANLNGANLSNAGLSHANLSGAKLYGANLSNAGLSHANLNGAVLYRANLYDAKLSGADLTNVRTSEYTIGFYLQCPEEGSFIAYKKARFEKIVVLQIPADAKRSSATTFKCRCDKAEVLRIENLDGSISDLKSINSLNDANFYYRVGETVFVDSFDENRWNECSHGIHFFISRELARIYDG